MNEISKSEHSIGNAAKWRIGLLIVLLFVSGCSESNVPDREAIIRAVFAAEASRWQSADRQPCVQPGLWQPGDIPVTYEQVGSFPQSWLPQQLKPCRGRGADGAGSLWLQDIEIGEFEALVDIDYQCGAMCGEGSTYRLEPMEQGWKVVERHQAWIS